MNDFYKQCAELLGTTYECESFPFNRRTRWNNRKAGGGRFPGFGIIRKFGDNIQVVLRNPVVHQKNYDSEEKVLDFLRTLK